MLFLRFYYHSSLLIYLMEKIIYIIKLIVYNYYEHLIINFINLIYLRIIIFII